MSPNYQLAVVVADLKVNCRNFYTPLITPPPSAIICIWPPIGLQFLHWLTRSSVNLKIGCKYPVGHRTHLRPAIIYKDFCATRRAHGWELLSVRCWLIASPERIPIIYCRKRAILLVQSIGSRRRRAHDHDNGSSDMWVWPYNYCNYFIDSSHPPLCVTCNLTRLIRTHIVMQQQLEVSNEMVAPVAGAGKP